MRQPAGDLPGQQLWGAFVWQKVKPLRLLNYEQCEQQMPSRSVHGSGWVPQLGTTVPWNSKVANREWFHPNGLPDSLLSVEGGRE